MTLKSLPPPMLQLDALTVQFHDRPPAVPMLDGISFTLREGQLFALVGASGCGKSLTALSMLGLLPAGAAAVSGQLVIGMKVYTLTDSRRLKLLRGRRLALVLQEPGSALNPVFTIGYQLRTLVRRHRRLARAAAGRAALDLLAQLGFTDPSRVAALYPHQMSGGMQQRAGIAMALAGQPHVLVADEPTTALDVIAREQLADLLRHLCRSVKMAVLFLTHDLTLVERYADWLAVMYEGRIVESGPCSTVFADPRHPYTRALLEAQPTSTPVVSLPCCGEPRQASSPMLTVTHLSVNYQVRRGVWRSRTEVVQAAVDVNFSVGPSRTVAVVGGSGSGKTTVALAIAGLLPPAAGAIWFEGIELTAQTPATFRQYRHKLQMVFQHSHDALDPERTARQSIEEGLLSLAMCRDAVERLERVNSACAAVRLDQSLLNRRPAALSAGQRQRVCLARALVLRPRLLICDEPTASLDPPTQAAIVSLLLEQQACYGMSYVFITHDLALSRKLAHEVVVMSAGRVVEQGLADDVFSTPEHPQTRALLAAARLLR